MSAQIAIDFTAARALRDAGMTQAIQHAERHDDEWPDLAYGFLCRYARSHASFQGWQVTDAADATGYGSPADSRAWGVIYRRALKDGVIVMDGMGRNPHRHASICPRYVSLVFVGDSA